VFFVVYLSLSLPAALLLHYLVEKPFLLIKARIRG
jgi:peptidoglycan/LPS O-acetylase OafA/YrhL